jgi:hypothetical protein
MIQEKLIKLANSVPNVIADSSRGNSAAKPGYSQYRVEGSYEEECERLRVRLQFIPLQPANDSRRQSISLLLTHPSPFLNVDVYTSVEEGGKIVAGRPFTIYVKSNCDCYFTVLNRNSKGLVSIIYPAPGENDRLTAGSVIALSDIELEPPYGREVLFVYAARHKFEPEVASRRFHLVYNEQIKNRGGTRSIRRKDTADDWCVLHSIPAR